MPKPPLNRRKSAALTIWVTEKSTRLRDVMSLSVDVDTREVAEA